jgi:hypothetical protein
MNAGNAMLFLQNCPEENVFRVSDGRMLRNLEELHMALNEMSDDTFKYHVNEEKNDFHNWVKDIFNDAVLANDLLGARTKEMAHKKVRTRVNSLKKQAKKK